MVVKERITKEDKSNTLSKITTYNDIAKGVKGADLVVEAATENKELKLKIFSQLNNICNKDTILASNTSSASIFSPVPGVVLPRIWNTLYSGQAVWRLKR